MMIGINSADVLTINIPTVGVSLPVCGPNSPGNSQFSPSGEFLVVEPPLGYHDQIPSRASVHVFTARCYAGTVYFVALCLSVSPRVSYKSVFYQNG